MYVSNDHHDASTSNTPWNRGKLTGQKQPDLARYDHNRLCRVIEFNVERSNLLRS